MVLNKINACKSGKLHTSTVLEHNDCIGVQVPLSKVWSLDLRVVDCFISAISCTSSRRAVNAARLLRLFVFKV